MFIKWKKYAILYYLSHKEEHETMVDRNYRSYYILIPMFLLAFLFTGCASIKTTSYFKPVKIKLGTFQAIQFDKFETEIVDFPEKALSRVPAETAALLATKDKFKEVEFGAIENIPAEDTIVVLGEVSEYRPSSDISYEGGGVKFGEVSITIKLALVNKATGDEISTGEVNGFSSMGFLAKDIYESLAKEIVKYILEGY
jgi:hypothetical protein